MTQRTAENWLDGLDTDPDPDYVPEYASWPKASGNPVEAEKLAAALRAAEHPDPIDPYMPEYMVTRNFSEGVSIWTVTTSGPIPESGVHRGALDANRTSLNRDPLELAYTLLDGFDYDG